MRWWVALVFVAGCGLEEAPWLLDVDVPRQPVGRTDRPVEDVTGWRVAPVPETRADPRFAGGLPWELPRVPEEVTADPAPWTRSSRLAVRGDRIVALDVEGAAVVALHRVTGRQLWRLQLEARPDSMVVGPDGVVFVTIRTGEVLCVEDGAVCARRNVGVDPRGLAMAPDGRVLYVAVTASRVVTSLNPEGLAVLGRAGGFVRPRLVVADSEKIWVGEEARVAEVALDADGRPVPGSYTTVPLRTAAPMDDLLRQGRPSLTRFGVAVSLATEPETGDVLILHEQSLPSSVWALYSDWASPLGDGYDGEYTPFLREGTTPNAWVTPVELSVTRPGVEHATRLPSRDPATGAPVSFLGLGAADIAPHPTRALAFVAARATGQVLVLDTAGDPLAGPLGAITVGSQPTAVAFSEDGAVAYVLEEGDRTIGRVDLAAFLAPWPVRSPEARHRFWTQPQPRTDGDRHLTWPVRVARGRVLHLGPSPLTAAQERGQRLFEVARGGFSCATCHPEGLSDGRPWGRGIPVQSHMLAGRTHAAARVAVEVERMGSTPMSDAEVQDLLAYLATRTHPPNPTAASALGAEVFARLDCGTCHIPPDYTDGLPHDVGTGGIFQTPSLVGLHHSRPYLHHARARSLRQVFAYPGQHMTSFSTLSAEEMTALVVHLQSL